MTSHTGLCDHCDQVLSYYGHRHFVFLGHIWTNCYASILTAREPEDMPLATSQSEGSRIRKHALLYHPFFSEWDHHLQNEHCAAA